MIRLQFIFLFISAFVYVLTGLLGKYSKRQRLIYAVITYAILFAAVLAMVLVSGDTLH